MNSFVFSKHFLNGLTVIIIVIIIITFMLDVYNYVPETNDNSVMLQLCCCYSSQYFPRSMFCSFTLVLPAVICMVLNMAVFCSF